MIVRGLFVALCCICNANVLAAEPPITAVTFSPDAQKVVVASQQGVEVYRWPSLEREDEFAAKLKPYAPNVHAVVFSPIGDRIAVGGGVPADEWFVHVFSWPELKPVAMLNRHTDSVKDVAWLDNVTLASASLDHQVIVWNVPRTNPIHILKGHSRGVMALAYVPSKKILVSAGIDQSLRVWDTDSWSLIHSLGIHTLPVNDLALRPGNHGLPMVASASDDRSVRLWQPSIGRMVRFARLKSKPLAIAWSPNGDRILAVCTDGQMRSINPDTVEVLETKPVVEGWAYCVSTDLTENQVVSGGSDGQLVRIRFSR